MLCLFALAPASATGRAGAVHLSPSPAAWWERAEDTEVRAVAAAAGAAHAARTPGTPGARATPMSASSPLAATDLAHRPGYLQNPGMGFHGWNDRSTALPASVEYSRIEWRTVHLGPGSYNWRPIDDLLAANAARGEQAAVRFMTMLGEDYGGHLVPQWVIAAGATVQDNGEPDYRNRHYLTHYTALIEAARARYDGDPRLAFIDIGGYGLFNEWQNSPVTDDGGTRDLIGATTADAGARRLLIHAHAGGSGTIDVRETNGSTGSMTYSFPGFRSTALVMPYGGNWAATRYVLATYPHVGWRNDALLGRDATFDVLKQIGYGIEERWKTAPVMFEPLHGSTPDSFSAGRSTLQGMGAVLLHDNSLAASSTELAKWVERVGYRYHPTQVRSPVSVARGGQLRIEADWTNVGYSRAYPLMGQDFTIAFALADAAGTVVASGTTEDDVSEWLPGEKHTAALTMTAPGEVPAGSYTRLIGVHDRTTGDRINLPVATDRSDQWYPAGTVTLN